jgi:hypothetical protein
MLLFTVKIKGGLMPPIYIQAEAIRPVCGAGKIHAPTIIILPDIGKNTSAGAGFIRLNQLPKKDILLQIAAIQELS